MDYLEGCLLVASPRLPDPNFYRSVVLIIQHDEQGAFGLILNRATDNSVGEVWSMITEKPVENDQPVHFGGPVGGPLLALHANKKCIEREVVPGVYFATHRDHLNKIVGEPAHPFRIFSGYSGWGAGQLENELKSGSWMTIAASARYVFGNTDEMWKQAAQEIGEEITLPLVAKVGVPSNPATN